MNRWVCITGSIHIACMAMLMLGCVSNQQLMRFEDSLSRTQDMVRTSQSEAKANHQAVSNQLNQIKSRIDAIGNQLSEIIQNLDRMQASINDLNKAVSQMHTTSQAQYPDYSSYPPFNPSGSFTSPTPGNLNPLEQQPEQIYQTAYNDYVNRKFDIAIVEFNDFLRSFPDSNLADNAQYWIGECFFSKSDYTNANIEFEKYLQNYPTGDKVTDAMLRLGQGLYENGDLNAARKILEDLTARFPFSEKARIAEEYLRKIKKMR